MLSNRGELQPQNGKKLRILRIHVVLSENISECCKWSKYYANKITTKTYLHWATSRSPTCKTMYTQNDISNNRKRCKVKRFTTCKATYAQNDVNNNKPFDGRCELWGRGWMFLRMYVMMRNEMCGIRGMFTDSRTWPQRVHDALTSVNSKTKTKRNYVFACVCFATMLGRHSASAPSNCSMQNKKIRNSEYYKEKETKSLKRLKRSGTTSK